MFVTLVGMVMPASLQSSNAVSPMLVTRLEIAYDASRLPSGYSTSSVWLLLNNTPATLA